MPKKSIDRNPITIVSSQGTDASGSDTSLIGSLDTSVVASEVISSNNTNEYLGYNVQLNLDDLTSDALEGQPPRLGFGPITFSNGSVSSTHDGRPDWGQAKVVDNPPWLTQRKKWAERFEMPHYYYGTDMTENPSSTYDAKYINPLGKYDTVNFNYRNSDINSDQGLSVNTVTHGQGTPYEFENGYGGVQQSVPRTAFQNIEATEIYPFSYKNSSVSEESVSDFFNSATGITLGFNAGTGTSSLSVKEGQASISLGSPFRTTTYLPSLTEGLTDLTVSEPLPQDVGIVVSGVLFPADRGVVALVRFASDPYGVATSFVGSPATTVDDIESRVIGAINLGQGAGPNDGSPGDVIFNNTSSDTFPSRKTGQYDLYELHTGNYTTESTRSGPIADLVGVPDKTSIGKVRLLTNANAFDGSTTRVGGIPVLFSPFEKISKQSNLTSLPWADFYSESDPEPSLGAYVIDSTGATIQATINTGTSEIDIDPANVNTPFTYYAYVLKEERNFLSYRMPVLRDYSPNGLQTPPLERDRFFIKRKPNQDQDSADYANRFTTAGGYTTFGEQDNYSFQVARYRQVITLTNEYTLDGTTSTGVNGGLALDSAQPEFNFGSIALMHFKTERAFESFVRDGVAPSESDLYSQSLVDYSTLNNNVGEYLGMTGGDGLTDTEASYQPSKSLSVFRPNLNFLQKSSLASFGIKSKSQSYGIHPTEGDIDTLSRDDTYFSWVSGVLYAHPNSWFSYKGHGTSHFGGSVNRATETQNTKFRVEIEITKKFVQGTDSMSDWTNTEANPSVPFETIRPTLQILTSDLTASNNLVANSVEYFDNDTLPQYTITTKHQQVWANATDLKGGVVDGNIAVIPTGDSVKAVNDLTLYDSKQGLCTFTTVGFRPSVLLNNPHKQFENLGVISVKDDLSNNSLGFTKKVLYHSSRKLSLLELYGDRLIPTGTTLGGGSAIANANIYVMDKKGPTGVDPFGTGVQVYAESHDIVGQEYRNKESFAEVFLQARWENNDPISSVLTPKSCGQAFSIYRYDEEGYKVYVELELLPIGGDEANGYALELCTGWDWVRNTQQEPQLLAGVDADYYYRSDVPVYRPVENTPTRVAATSHMDAKYIAIKDVDYYIECHPSVPYDHDIGINGIKDTQGLNLPPNTVIPEFQVVPSAWNKSTKQKSGIYQLGQTWGYGNAARKADLYLDFQSTSGVNRIYLYENMGDNTTYIQSNALGPYYGEGINTNTHSAGVFVNCQLGATVHLCGSYLQTYSSTDPEEIRFANFLRQVKEHPHPALSLTKDGIRNFGERIVEVIPTGRKELPEYGNFTQDVLGYITFSGQGNRQAGTTYNLHAVDTQTRFPLTSLLTPRKDTQERFLDESYRIEHSLLSVLDNNDPDTSYQFGNHSDVSGATPAVGNTELRSNLVGPGLPHFGSGVNGGYISFPVRDEVNYSPRMARVDKNNNRFDPATYPLPNLMKFSHHGYAGYLRNNLHLRRIKTTNPLDPLDWLEAQVSGFPNMTRNHLSGSKYGTPPRGILVYPSQNFFGPTVTEFGYDLNYTTNGAANRNPLIDSHVGWYLPNTDIHPTNLIPGNADKIDSGFGWVDDGVATLPLIRHAQPDYSSLPVKPDVGYLRAFDLNFGKSNERSPHIPYWNRDWTETANGNQVDRLAEDADPQGLIESGEWVRYKVDDQGNTSFTPIKLRLVGIDWDMISYVDPKFPNARRDGTVYTIDSKKYLMRKRVMRVFVKVPGLTTWLDVGVMNGEVGESYVQYAGDPTGTFGGMNEGGATSDKTHPSIDGAGCCVSYKETFLVEEGLVALDLELDVGFVPAFNTLGTENFEGSANEYEWLGSHDEYLGEKAKTIWVGNSTRHYGDTIYRKWGAGNKEAPILVKVILSDPDNPSYELHPNDPTALVDRVDLDNLLVLEANVYPNGTREVYDIWPSPNKSYRGHSFPPDDRAPTWARRGLMGIEVLRPDGSNFDRDEVIDRPEYTKINLFGDIDTTTSNGEDDRTLYMLHYDDAQQTGTNASGYLRGATALSHDGTNVIKTNKQTYTFAGDVITPIGGGVQKTLTNKGKG